MKLNSRFSQVFKDEKTKRVLKATLNFYNSLSIEEKNEFWKRMLFPDPIFSTEPIDGASKES